jgi:hypothetical protein
MKALIIFVGLCLLALPADAQPARPVPPLEATNAERSALARQYLELAKPELLDGEFEVDHTLAKFMMPRTMEEANLSIKGAPPSSSPISRIVYGQLKASFERGAKRIAPKLADALVAAYARLLTVEELRTLIAFEEQPSRHAAEAAFARVSAHMRAFFDAAGARWDEELKTGIIEPSRSLAPLDDIEKLIPTEAQPAPAASPTWDAIVAKQTAIYLATYAQLNRLWPEAAAVARVDYCAHVRCRATDRQILTSLGQVFADPNNRV